MNVEEILALVQMIFDTIKKYFAVIFGNGNEVEKDDTATN